MSKPYFTEGITYENDIEGFIMPYKLCSRTDVELMKEKYFKLRKISYGYIVRLGIAERR